MTSISQYEIISQIEIINCGVELRIITKKKLIDFALEHPAAREPIDRWILAFKRNDFKNITEIKASYPSVDRVGELYVFNLGGNNFRLVVKVLFNARVVFIRAIMTHAEYDKNKWKRYSWITKE